MVVLGSGVAAAVALWARLPAMCTCCTQPRMGACRVAVVDAAMRGHIWPDDFYIQHDRVLCERTVTHGLGVSIMNQGHRVRLGILS